MWTSIQNFGECTPVSNQLDLCTGIQGRLQYEFMKGQMQLDKNHILLEQKKAFEMEMQKVKLQYRTFLETLSYTIYEDSAGRLIFAVTHPSNEMITSKPLLNVSGYRSFIYFSYWPDLHYVLSVSWESGTKGEVCFKNAGTGLEPQKFLKTLKSRGVLFLVSGRTEKKAAEALLAYSYQNAEQLELPFYHGWNMMQDETWYFADRKSLTLREVEKNAV